MARLKLYVVFGSLCAAALACDLKSSTEELLAKEALEANITSAKELVQPRYRLHYHVAPPVGWMNDPNGFSFFNGYYHLFYQYYPYDIKTGNIHWGHVISPDLVNWELLPTALIPGPERVFSGSAIEKDGTLILMYTADILFENGSYTETQDLAFSNDGIVFNKYKKNPVISYSYTGSPDFRDPKVWKYEDYYYVILGTRTPGDAGEKQGNGTVLLYRSPDMGSWEFYSVLAQSNGDLGYMWECPDFFELNGSYVLLMSPQGMEPLGDRYQNLHQTGYIIGSFNYATGTLEQTVAFQEIDYGHDFYATQTMEKDGKRYLIAWMGDWNATFYEAEDGWAGAMTIFRELKLNDDRNRVLMTPVDTMINLRQLPAIYNESLPANGNIAFNKTGELIVNGNWAEDINLEIKGIQDETLISLKWNATNEIVALDRQGEVRQGPWSPQTSSSWRIFLDASSIELFCGEGEVVFSSRAYPNGTWQVTNLGSLSLNVVAYFLNRSVPE